MDQPDRPVALFVALEAEARGMIGHLVLAKTQSPQLSVWEGQVDGTPVVLALTGVGKVAAALAAQFVCDIFHPRCAISFGLAGAVESDSPAGQLIVASGALQHDMDARPLTDAKGTIPSLGKAILPSNRALSEKLRRAAAAVVENPAPVSGLVLTGDQIITSRQLRDGLLRDFPQGRCFDMETAAVAQAAYQNDIPWAGLRMTSDAADESFILDDVLSFGIGTAAGLFEQILRAFLRET
jgi:adenosylhomocysteine nucleosidase